MVPSSLAANFKRRFRTYVLLSKSKIAEATLEYVGDHDFVGVVMTTKDMMCKDNLYQELQASGGFLVRS